MSEHDPFASVTPEMRSFVDAGQLAGVATLVWQGGEVAHQACVGWRDLEARLPMTRDTIMRVASMSKPITSVAALTLVDEGRISLSDPIARWAPELAEMRVLRSLDGALHDTEPARESITFGDLLTHRAGFTYGSFHAGPIADAYADALGPDIDSHLAPDDWIAALAELPLIDQPGHTLHYGHSTDLLGLLMARIEDAPLEEVLARRVLEPLGMSDTSFVVPPKKRHRRSKAHGFDGRGRLVVRDTCPGGATVPERPADMAFASGGQGLWSTLDDYLAFARLFVGGGAVDGRRVLEPSTLALMTTDQLSQHQHRTAEVGGASLFRAGLGFGLGVAVVLDPQRADASVCGGGQGCVGWPGAYGGWWSADARNNSVMIFLAQNMVELDQLGEGVGFGVFEAISRFRELAERALHRV